MIMIPGKSCRPFLKLLGLLVFLPATAELYAQQKIKGVVADANRDRGLYQVQVVNKNTGELTTTNAGGAFEIQASRGDMLGFVKKGFLSVNVLVDSLPDDPMEVYLYRDHPSSADTVDWIGSIPGVTVYGRSYERDSLLLREEYGKYFPQPPAKLKIAPDGSLDLTEVLVSALPTPRDKEFQQRLIEYEQNQYIDKVFTPERVRSVIDIPEEELPVFMRTFRPSYRFLVRASEYDFVKYVKDSYKLFSRGQRKQRHPAAAGSSSREQ